jgi:hypothetical protein
MSERGFWRGLIFKGPARLGRSTPGFMLSSTFAHRSLCAAAILRGADGDLLGLGPAITQPSAPEPSPIEAVGPPQSVLPLPVAEKQPNSTALLWAS